MNPEFMRIEQSSEVTDSKKHEFGFGEGGVPWFLLLGYLAFLVFFTWYVVEYQLKDFEEHSPFPVSAETDSAGAETGSDSDEQ